MSSRRNQLLMDISSELGVASVDGAAEATVKALSALVNKVAPNYKAFGPVLSDIVRDRVRGMFGAAGVKLGQITKRVTDTWQLGEGWASHVVAALVLETREGASSRGGDLASLSTDAASNATAANALIDAAVQKVAADKGIDARFFSRANDRRRGGFVESQGGGTILLTRGDIALKLGLPVAGVIGFVHSYADGAHTSIPAPGLGALAAGMGGKDSKLVRDLARLGVTPDDIAVVSKHDTSTNANDPNESELHNTLAHALGRADGNPLFVISQKTLTGHAKGGACIFQVNGLTQLFKSGVIPANAALDCVDPKLMRDDHMVWLREPLKVGSVKAGLATSLGFGHVSGFAAIVNPGAFEAAVANTAGVEALNAWRDRANERLAAGQRRLEEGMMGRAALYEPIDNRRFHEDGRGYNAHEVEKAMLLDPNARLSASGYFEA